MNIYTIGFTRKSADYFFNMLRHSGAKRVVDVRLNNVSQLAGFAKKDDLRFFLKEVCDMDYVHLPELAPTKEIFDEYKKNNGEWDLFREKFLKLMALRQVEKKISKDIINNGCLLCSEDKPHNCHRRLVAEYLQHHWGDISIDHIT